MKVNFHVVLEMEQSESYQSADLAGKDFYIISSKIIYYERSDRFP